MRAAPIMISKIFIYLQNDNQVLNVKEKLILISGNTIIYQLKLYSQGFESYLSLEYTIQSIFFFSLVAIVSNPRLPY